MEEWISTILQGILLGGLYALFALGLSLVFGVMRVINVAHGDLIVMAAFGALVVSRQLGINALVSLAVVVPAMFAVGYVLQRALLQRTLTGDPLPPLLVTFGLSIIIQNVLMEIFSANSRKLQADGLETLSLRLTDQIAVGTFPLIVLASAVVIILALRALIYRSALGRAFRATSDAPEIARLFGIDDRRVFAFATGLAGAVVGVAGVFLAVQTNFDPSIGPARLIYAFEAVIIGGVGSLWGTLGGGVILGVAQVVGGRIDPAWQVLSGHLVFLVLMYFRPRGLFPRAFD